MVCLFAEHDRSCGKNNCITMSGKETLFRFGAARQTGAGYRIAGYKLPSGWDLSSARASDAPPSWEVITRGERCFPLLASYTPRPFLLLFKPRGARPSLISRSRIHRLQFKGWITPDTKSEITILREKPSIRVRMNVDLDSPLC